MRTDFWRGIIAGGIIGAVVSIMAGGRYKTQRKRDTGYFARMAGERASKMIRGILRNG
ncbi:hypothetical protein L7E55_05475 [Pelotomaculum isophthalicicum JI]|uniref:YtxH domain-containing protein n=1 Tax=Pelotomaculum isophthalicicum JI TaxID=947010 RepID=A0A9X4JVQ4_9FIRM|nr:hypothetical protein [Pelotomaculum isophthalicicum]MDF9407813.1 hypothetical protein [Pelotomaculum isophthalicicum JI]